MITKYILNDEEKLEKIEITKELQKNKSNTYGTYTKTLALIPTALFNAFYPAGWEKGTYIYIYKNDKNNLILTPQPTDEAYKFNIRRDGAKGNRTYKINFNKNINKLVDNFDNKKYIKLIIGIKGIMIEFS